MKILNVIVTNNERTGCKKAPLVGNNHETIVFLRLRKKNSLPQPSGFLSFFNDACERLSSFYYVVSYGSFEQAN